MEEKDYEEGSNALAEITEQLEKQKVGTRLFLLLIFSKTDLRCILNHALVM